MAVPKKKHSHGRRTRKDANKRLYPASVRECSQCGTVVRPHRVCTTCGFYRGKEVVELLD